MSSLAVACFASACEPKLIVGTWTPPPDTAGGAGASSGVAGGGGLGGVAGGGGLGGVAGGGGLGGVAGAGLGGSSGGGAAGTGSAGSTAGGGVAGDITGGSAGDTEGGAGGENGCAAGGAPVGPATAPIAVPWQTGFENGFCDYVEQSGFCYTEGDASYEVVAVPAHTGESAAAFSVNSAEAGAHARCVRQGTLPSDAYYGAWFYVPTPADQAGLWNLFLFQGHNGEALERLWDVSIGKTDAGGQALFVFDHRGGEVLEAPAGVEIPIGAWFHVEFRLRRAADASGLVALYQDGLLLLERMRPTDDTSWGQWYAGNLTEGRSPPDSTVYLDDVTIRAAP